MRYSNREAVGPIARHEDFVTNNETLRGRTVSYTVTMGYLPDEHRAALNAALAEGHVYVVSSYATPIAWWTPANGWTVPAVRYSPTTSRHQTVVRRAS